MAGKHLIVGVHITDRVQHASEVQAVLTEYGCNIKTRLGLHEVGQDCCAPNGVLLIEFVGTDARCASMVKKLAKVKGIQVQKMVFTHK